MYFLDKIGAGQAALLTGSVLIPRKISIDKLQNAVNEVFRINNCLRVYFIEKDGAVYQDYRPFERKEFKVRYFNSKKELDDFGEVYGTIPLKLDIRTEGSGVPKEMWKTEKPSLKLLKNILIHKVKLFFTKKRMHITDEEPSCCEIIIVDLPDSCGAIIKTHHIISDAWTMLLMANQFLRILNGETVIGYEYEEFVEKEKEYRLSERFERDCNYMNSEYNKLQEATWRWPYPYTSLESVRSTVVLDKELTSRIKEYSEANGLSPYIIFFTAISIYMYKMLDRVKFYLGTLSLNRSNFREKNTVGLFVAALPVLVELDENDSFAETTYKVRDKSVNVARHQKGDARPNDGKELLYDIWVSYQNAVLEADPTAVITQYYCKSIIDNTVFSIEDRISEGQFKLHFDYNVKTPKKDVDELFDMVISVISKSLNEPNTKIKDL